MDIAPNGDLVIRAGGQEIVHKVDKGGDVIQGQTDNNDEEMQ